MYVPFPGGLELLLPRVVEDFTILATLVRGKGGVGTPLRVLRRLWTCDL